MNVFTYNKKLVKKNRKGVKRSGKNDERGQASTSGIYA